MHQTVPVGQFFGQAVKAGAVMCHTLQMRVGGSAVAMQLQLMPAAMTLSAHVTVVRPHRVQAFPTENSRKL